MGRFDKGVSYYTFAEANIQMAFPEDEVKCKWCKFVRHYDGLNRDKCPFTDEVLVSLELVGWHCPFTVINSVKTEEIEK